jgi:hypothetical protein
MLLERVLTNLAGTNSEQHDRFLEQVETQHRAWKLFFLLRSLAARLLRPEDFDRFPYFKYEPQGIDEIVNRLSGPLAALALMPIFTIATGFVLLGKYST